MRSYGSTLALALALVTSPALAQMTNAQTIATLGGRIVGAAKRCGEDGTRIRKVSEQVFSTVNVRAKSEREAGSATMLFVEAYNAGIDQVVSGKVNCRDARAAFYSMESDLAKR